MMGLLSEALIWFLFVIVCGILFAFLVLLVASIVKSHLPSDAVQGRPPDVPASPSAPSVTWIEAVAVVHPDDSRMMAVKEPTA